MTTHIVSTHEAKTRLSELIREAEEGQDVIVARNGRPVAKIIPWPPSRPNRTLGSWAGRVEYRSDVIGSDDEVNAMFEESATRDAP